MKEMSENMKKKILIASFFSILMIMTSFTTVTGSVDNTADSNQVSTNALIDLNDGEIRLLREILDRIFNGELELNEEEVKILEEIAYKLDYEIELTDVEIKLIREIFSRIFNGEMKSTEEEIELLGDILNKITEAETKIIKDIEPTSTDLEGSITSCDFTIPLTTSQIAVLDGFVDSFDFEDDEIKAIAEDIVDQLVTEDDELDLTIIEEITNDEYQPLTGPVRQILSKFLNKLRTAILTIIKEYMSNYFSHGRSGWIGVTVGYFMNVTTKLQDVLNRINNIINEVNKILTLIDRFITFISEPSIVNIYQLCVAAAAALGSAKSILDNISLLPFDIQYTVKCIANNASDFTRWFAPDIFYPDEGYDENDRAYNQPIYINVEVLNAPGDIMLYCDEETYYVNAGESEVLIIYTTTDEANPSFTEHDFSVSVKVVGENNPRIEITEHGYSTSNINMTFDFSGKPIRPYGPIYGKVLETPPHLYFSYAINPYGNGEEGIYYQWHFDEWPYDPGEWHFNDESGYLDLNCMPHVWLFGGILFGENHSVKVRAGDTPDGSGWVSPWSDPLYVWVSGIIDISFNLGLGLSVSQSTVTQSTSESTIVESTSETTEQSSSQSTSY